MMLLRVRLLCALICAVQLVPGQPRIANAQELPPDSDAAARRAFEAGRDAYDHGSFAAALAHFERAYALRPSPELLYNVGRAADSDGQPRRAIEAYSAYIEANPGVSNWDFVHARLEKMRALERDRIAVRSSAASELPTVAQAERSADHHDAPARPLWKRAWLWSALGALVVGGVVTGVLLATRDREPARTDADAYVLTLEAR